MPINPGSGDEPPPPPTNPDPPPMSARDLDAVLDRATAASSGCPWEVREAADAIRAWLASLPPTALL